ncbi:MAG TPA: xanthine dehydrogenase family protein molybdopterin-binding subunit [Gaiellaceae bacterium]|nr:xanthine dehydrogenase family protein molybdopterin-binding subunit [Gaiellaceae bacterium]
MSSRDRTDLLLGGASFVADVVPEGCLSLAVVRSPEPHARVAGISAERARALPGVRAVLTAADLDRERTIPMRNHVRPHMEERLQPVLARDRVRYVGEPLALVVADDAYLAEDAAELVQLELEPLPPVASVEQGSPEPLFDGLDNVICRWEAGDGDVEAAFAEASHVVSASYRVARTTAIPLEGRGVVASWSEDGSLDLWGPTKFLDFTRRTVAGWFDLGEDRVRCRTVRVGGMFGVRGELYPEDFLVPWAARVVGSPVRWIEDRREHFLTINQSREQVHDYALALDADGRFLGFRSRASLDLGAYARPLGARLPMLVPILLPGPYRWPAFSVVSEGIATNKTPAGTIRGPGALDATLVREQTIDMAAARLGIDPLELRRRNFIAVGELPHTRSFGPEIPAETVESGDFAAMCDEFTARIGYAGLAEEAERRRESGEAVGVGLAAYLVDSAVGTTARARVSIAGGRAAVRSTATDVGQGLEALLRRIAAGSLGLDPDLVDVEWGSTVDAPPSGGTAASRSTVVLGNAVRAACEALLERLELGAGELAGRIRELPPATAEGEFTPDEPTLGFGMHAALVSLDPELLEPRIERIAVAYDAGHVIDRSSVVGQLTGAAVQALGQTLYEEISYDDAAQPLTTTFMDYLLPTAAEAPPVEVVLFENPDPGNPLGARGAGEAGVFGVAAAVASAVAQALGRAEEGVTELPISPRSLRPSG